MGYPLVLAALILLAVAAVVLAFFSLMIAKQYERAVVFRLGRYNRTAGPGLYFLVPFIEWKTILDLRTKTAIVEAQETITRDNVPIKINTVIWQRIIDLKRAAPTQRLSRLQEWLLQTPCGRTVSTFLAQSSDSARIFSSMLEFGF